MRIEERRTLLVAMTTGMACVVLFMPAVYFLGLWLAPPRPVPATAHVPALLGDALWARADGGRATAMQPINPIRFVRMRVCRTMAAQTDDLSLRAQRRAECMKILPAIQAADYLSGVHMQAEHVPEDGFRHGISQFATAAWLTRSWTRAELLDTLASRGDFGFGWHNADAASQGYFGRSPSELDLAQSALLAAFIGDRVPDPWCNPDAARDMRRRILERMRDNLAIDDGAFQSASGGGLGLAAPPATHKACEG